MALQPLLERLIIHLPVLCSIDCPFGCVQCQRCPTQRVCKVTARRRRHGIGHFCKNPAGCDQRTARN